MSQVQQKHNPNCPKTWETWRQITEIWRVTDEERRTADLEKKGFVGGKDKWMTAVDHLDIETTDVYFKCGCQKWQAQ